MDVSASQVWLAKPHKGHGTCPVAEHFGLKPRHEYDMIKVRQAERHILDGGAPNPAALSGNGCQKEVQENAI